MRFQREFDKYKNVGSRIGRQKSSSNIHWTNFFVPFDKYYISIKNTRVRIPVVGACRHAYVCKMGYNIPCGSRVMKIFTIW